MNESCIHGQPIDMYCQVCHPLFSSARSATSHDCPSCQCGKPLDEQYPQRNRQERRQAQKLGRRG